LAGPVVAGAVILFDTAFEHVIDDSKKLSAKRRDLAYAEIVQKAHVGVGIVDERTIDDMNIYQATIRAMQIAVANLPLKADYVIIDGNMNVPLSCPGESIVRGDSKSLSIAAASIIAKVTRDRIMERFHEQYPQYGFARHKGYATLAHRNAIRQYGISPIHRRSFSSI